MHHFEIDYMTLKELYIKLKELDIPEDNYYLHGIYGSVNDDDKLALIVKKEKNTMSYEVYYKERGEKHSIRKFANEDQACQYMLKCLIENKEIED